jgi:hypothetical protein
MSGKEINIAIAKILGWIQSECGNWIIRGVVVKAIVPPNYCNDLNAMHEAEKVLTANQFDKYCYRLDAVGGMRHCTHATAAQRAEAFLKTLRMWNGAK